jgi:signal transduction histidine kinase/HAMP domain-containing protein
LEQNDRLIEHTEHSEQDRRILRRPVTHPGLKARLALWFVLLTFVPLIALDLICRPMLERKLEENLARELNLAVSLKRRSVEQYFDEMKRIVVVHSQRPTNKALLETLKEGLALSGQAPRNYIGGEDWKARLEHWKDQTGRDGLMNLRELMLVDLDGTILYVSIDRRNLGVNVFTDSGFADSPLARGCRRALASTEPVFADYAPYPLRGAERILGHMVIRLNDRARQPMGFLALQFDGGGLNSIMGGHQDLGQTFAMYLVGEDLMLRTDVGTRQERSAFKYRIDGAIIQSPAGFRGEGISGARPMVRYRGPEQAMLRGVAMPIRVDQETYHLVGEIEEREAFQLVSDIRRVFGLTAFALAILVLVASVFFAGDLVRQIRVLTDWARNVATGNLSVWDIQHRDDELGRFIDSFNQVVLFLNETARLALSVASGDLRAQIEPRSAHDELGSALRQMTLSLNEVLDAVAALAQGDFDVRVRVKGPNDVFATALNHMVARMKKAHEENQARAGLKTLEMELGEIMRGDQPINDLVQRVLAFFCDRFGASVGAFYLVDDDQRALYLYGQYACGPDHPPPPLFRSGEGLPGQALSEKRLIRLDHCPAEYLMIQGLVEAYTPASVLVFPFARGDRVEAVIEMGSLSGFGTRELAFLEQVSESVSIAMSSALARVRMEQLLAQTIKQAEDLKTHQEKLDGINRDLTARTDELQATEARLRAANLDLIHQTEKLKDSQTRLQQKEEELIAANQALEERSVNLEEQKNAIREKNIQLEHTQRELLEKSQRLENSSRYKTEFLSNMSHELRTPLNSILLISRLLGENRWGNLNERQVEFTRTIMTAGKDLLSLIDDILDLSKIESGRLDIHVSSVAIRDFQAKIRHGFATLCREKGIDWDVIVDEALPDIVYLDIKRVDQVVKNLVANAVKFTARGAVAVHIGIAEAYPPSVNPPDSGSVLRISVKDSGIGIDADKQALIFEAFKQADGTISREFGGTGLGLSISRQLVRLMGGDILVESHAGQGSVFHVFIPGTLTAPAGGDLFSAAAPSVFPGPETGVYQEKTRSTDNGIFSGRTLLIVDDDMRNVYALMHSLGDYGMEILVAKSGRQCLEVLENHPKTDLVIMDIMMPDMGGFEAMERMTGDPRFSAIPVIAITAKAMKGDREKCLQAGASEYLSKPVDMDRLMSVMKHLLT